MAFAVDGRDFGGELDTLLA